MNNQRKYVVYLTKYKGTKLPSWYIGSSYEEKVKDGYNGSVLSKKYKEIYRKEQNENKHLFKTRILSYHETREEATKEELRLQKLHNVVKNNKYFNESYARINGYFGRDVSGKNNPMYGKKMPMESVEQLVATMKKIQDNGKSIYKMSGEKCSKTLIENGLRKGKNNSQAKRINIFNDQNILVFECHGNFISVCRDNNLPLKSLANSYKNNGKVLYDTKTGFSRAKVNGNEKFKGWYAIEIK